MYAILIILVLSITVWSFNILPVSATSELPPDVNILQLSEKLLYAVKVEEPTDSLELELAGLTQLNLIHGLSNNNARKTFWINVYNAWYQILAVREKKSAPAIFTTKSIKIAGHLFSLDDIEHGILRKYRWKYSLGYLPQFYPSKLIKQLAVTKIDYRIHFAMNCGAKSCPPIAFYNYENIDKQLDMATLSFLKSETEIDEKNKVIRATTIMKWFIADFGGKKGIKNILQRNLNIDPSGYSIKFKRYNQSTELKNFVP